jgi:hypothetical protein
MTTSVDANGGARYKVGKVIDQYSLTGMGDKLEARWTGDLPDSYSLRELAAYFNKEVLRVALADTDHQQFSGGIDHIYRLLTDDDVSSGDRTRIRNALERDGIDVEALTQDFVTHQAIHTYLTKGRNVQKEEETRNRVENTRGTINRLRSRLIAVSETTLTQLRESGKITLGDFDVLVDINVHCTDCETHRNLFELLTDRGCECDQ